MGFVLTVESCVKKIRLIKDKFKTDHFVAIFSDGGIPAELTEKTPRRFAAEVMPEFKQEGVHVSDRESVQMASS